jgi:3-dehydroquinate synthase
LEKIIVNTSSFRSEILIGEKLDKVKELLPSKGVVIITDENVYNFYGQKFPGFPVLRIPAGESSKILKTIESLASQLLMSNIDRSGFILAIGGGVVCDIAGFLASVYMRGIRCGYVSTTLLSQVDASTGGKTGVDLGGVKNIIGTFRQPEFVICDPSMLVTLPDDEYLSGLAEIIKTAVIGDEELFDLINKQHSGILMRDPALLSMLITKSVRFKADVVSRDEKESGLRRVLNFGHTFGHALETTLSLKHGMAVAAGMKLAAHFSLVKNYIKEAELIKITDLIDKYQFPAISMPEPVLIENLIMHDKKKSGTGINFVFSAGIGKAVCKKTSAREIMDFYHNYREKNS